MDKLKKLFDAGWVISGEAIPDPGKRYILIANFKAYGDTEKRREEQFVSDSNLEKAISKLYDKCMVTDEYS